MGRQSGRLRDQLRRLARQSRPRDLRFPRKLRNLSEVEVEGVMRISVAQFVKKFGLLCDEALTRPVIITRHSRDRLVVMSLAMYRV
jgi:hypothetical protein